MIIQCPECDKKYKVPTTAVVGGGRLVRCTACEYEWLARPEDNKALAQEPLASDLDAIIPRANHNNIAQEAAPVAKEVVAEIAQEVTPVAKEVVVAASEASIVADVPEKQEVVVTGVTEQPIVEAKIQEVVAELAAAPVLNNPSLVATAAMLQEGVGGIKPLGKTAATSFSCWAQLTYILAFAVVSMLIIAGPAVLVWHDHMARVASGFAHMLEHIGIYNTNGLKISKVELESKEGAGSIEVGVNVFITNLAGEPRFIKALRFGAYDAEMEYLGSITIDINTNLAQDESKHVEGMLNKLPLTTTYITADIGNSLELSMRNVQHIYRFLK